MKRWFLDESHVAARPSVRLRQRLCEVGTAPCIPATESDVLGPGVPAIHVVTGGAGRSAAAWALRALLEADGQRCLLVQGDGTLVPPTARRAPARLAITGDSHAAERSAVVIDVPPTAAAIERLAGLPLDSVLVTALDEEWEGIGAPARAEFRRPLRRLVQQVKPQGWVAVDGEDREAERFGAVSLTAERLAYGPSVNGSVQVAEAEDSASASLSLRRGWGGELPPVTLPPQGPAMSTAAAGALALARALGVAEEVLTTTLEHAGLPPGRLESLAASAPCWSDRVWGRGELRDALRAVRSWVSGRVICVLTLPAQDSTIEGMAMARLAEDRADALVVTLDPASENTDADERFDQLLAACRRPGRVRLETQPDTALAAALEIATPDDAVLVVTLDRRHRPAMSAPALDPLGRLLADIAHRAASVQPLGTRRSA
jgi:UDP-N-acetylmuramoyl-L-alanyl-D-glutamate--2,6-diaminopimelate ligase